MNKEIKNWMATANYDLVTAGQMFKTGRHVYVVFMCHLAIEKTLKAIVSAETKKIPPKTHDLIYLLNFGKINLPANLLDFIGMINNASIVTRYPEDLSKLISSYPKTVAGKYLTATQEIIRCLRRDRRLKK